MFLKYFKSIFLYCCCLSLPVITLASNTLPIPKELAKLPPDSIITMITTVDSGDYHLQLVSKYFSGGMETEDDFFDKYLFPFILVQKISFYKGDKLIKTVNSHSKKIKGMTDSGHELEFLATPIVSIRLVRIKGKTFYYFRGYGGLDRFSPEIRLIYDLNGNLIHYYYNKYQSILEEFIAIGYVEKDFQGNLEEISLYYVPRLLDNK